MNDRSDQVKAIFLEAIEGHTPEQCPAFLERACGGDAELRAEVEKLLRARSELGSFHEPPRPGMAQTTDDPVRERPGVVIGPYKLIQELGTGGMGAVWMAQQTEPVKRLVALKVIKPGMDSRQVIVRFEAERQALALMDHPNIARGFRRRHDQRRPALFRHGIGQGRAAHQVLRRAPADAEAAASAGKMAFPLSMSRRGGNLPSCPCPAIIPSFASMGLATYSRMDGRDSFAGPFVQTRSIRVG